MNEVYPHDNTPASIVQAILGAMDHDNGCSNRADPSHYQPTEEEERDMLLAVGRMLHAGVIFDDDTILDIAAPEGEVESHYLFDTPGYIELSDTLNHIFDRGSVDVEPYEGPTVPFTPALRAKAEKLTEGMDANGHLTPDQADKFIAYTLDKSVLLRKTRRVYFGPWYRNPRVWPTAVFVAMAIVAILLAIYGRI